MGLSVTAVQKALKGADYPASKQDLADLAEENGADHEIIDALQDADAEDFDGPDEVMQALQDHLGDDADDDE
jgi:hypothetical protein